MFAARILARDSKPNKHFDISVALCYDCQVVSFCCLSTDVNENLKIAQFGGIVLLRIHKRLFFGPGNLSIQCFVQEQTLIFKLLVFLSAIYQLLVLLTANLVQGAFSD